MLRPKAAAFFDFSTRPLKGGREHLGYHRNRRRRAGTGHGDGRRPGGQVQAFLLRTALGHAGHKVTGEGVPGSGGVHRPRAINPLPEPPQAVVIHAAPAAQGQQQTAPGPSPPQGIQNLRLIGAARQGRALDLVEDQQPRLVQKKVPDVFVNGRGVEHDAHPPPGRLLHDIGQAVDLVLQDEIVPGLKVLQRPVCLLMGDLLIAAAKSRMQFCPAGST